MACSSVRTTQLRAAKKSRPDRDSECWCCSVLVSSLYITVEPHSDRAAVTRVSPLLCVPGQLKAGRRIYTCSYLALT